MPTPTEIAQGAGDISGTDKALQMFNEIFGEGWYKLLWTQGEGGGEAASLIFPLLHGFNIFVLVGIAALLLYVVGHGLIGSAHEGKFLGSRIHSIWVPIRGVFSISLLTPLPWAKGLSLIQVVLLAFIGFSIQGANFVSQKGMDFLSQNHGSVVAIAPDLRDAAEQATRTILESATAQYHQAYFQEENSLQGQPAYKEGWKTTQIKASEYNSFAPPEEYNVDKTTYIFSFTPTEQFKESDMGKLVVNCEDTQDNVCNARIDASRYLIDTLYPVAEDLVKYRHPDFDTQKPNVDKINLALDNYTNIVNSAISLKLKQDGADEEMAKFVDLLEKQGFFVLGEFYWTFTRMNERAINSVGNTLQSVRMSKSAINEKASSMFNEITSTLELAEEYVDVSFEEKKDIATSGREKEGILGMLKHKLLSIVSDPIEHLTLNGIRLLSSDDPVLGLAALGHGMLEASAAIYTGYVLFSATAKGASESALGKGVNFLTGAGAGASRAINLLLVPILLLCGPLFFAGISLAYYLPSLPFILWASAIIGWVILVVEALVAAPLWAAAHAVPEGEGIAGQHGKQGYNLFLHVLMYPILLVISFYMAILAIHLVSFVGEGFSVFFASYMGNYSFNFVVTAISGLVLAGIVAVTLAHKLFGLINWLPQHVFKWLGAQGHSLGPERDEQKMNSAFGVFASRSETAATGTAQRSSGGKKASQGISEAGGIGDSSKSKTHTTFNGHEDDHFPGNT